VPVVLPEAQVAGGYPLTSITYAATVPSALDQDSGNSYASLLRYAMGDGQSPGVAAGQLADGYVPLPESMRIAALTAAAAIESGAGQPEPTAPPTPGASPASTPAAPDRSAVPQQTTTAPAPPAEPPTRSSPAATAPAKPATATPRGGSGTGTGSRPQAPAAPVAPADPAPAPAAPSPSPAHTPVTLAPAAPAAAVARTVKTDVGAARYLLFGALIAGVLAGAAGLLVPRLLRGRP
jgi:hypothetical protein